MTSLTLSHSPTQTNPWTLILHHQQQTLQALHLLRLQCRQMPELAPKEEFARCHEQWQNQSHSFGKGNMHYMASQYTCEADYAREHDLHLELQERMRQPIYFLA